MRFTAADKYAHTKLVDGGCLKCDTLCVSLCVSVERAHASVSLICGDTRQQQQHKRRKKNPHNTLYTLSNVIQTEIFANTHACAAAAAAAVVAVAHATIVRRAAHLVVVVVSTTTDDDDERRLRRFSVYGNANY